MDERQATPVAEENRFLDDYAAWTDKTAQYPINCEPYYLAMGAVDEAGEMVEKIVAGGNVVDDQILIPEIGDVCWYLGRYTYRVLETSLHDLVAHAVDEYAKDGTDSDTLFIGLATLCGIEKKRLRDGDNWDDATKAAKRSRAIAAVGKSLAVLHRFCVHLGTTLIAVCEANQTKLNERLARNTIKGDGDSR